MSQASARVRILPTRSFPIALLRLFGLFTLALRTACMG